MATPNRSADSAYYASRKPLNIRGVEKEGRSRKTKPVSYRQKSSDVVASSDKYYAAPKPEIAAQPVKKAKKLVTLEASPQIIRKVSAAFNQGATDIVIEVVETELKKVRSATEMAVGQGKLTREQADSISFQSIKLPEPEPVQEPEAVKEKPKKPRKASKPRKKKAEPDPVIEEAEDILGSVAEEESLLVEADSITENDIAKAFGVDLDADDDSDE